MPSAKSKRARSADITAPSRTLHDFFSKPKAITTTSKLKSNASKIAKNAKGKAVDRSFTEQEVIVIDSDSDDDIEFVESTTSAKRRRLSPKNSDDRRGSTSRRSSLKERAINALDLPHSKENSATDTPGPKSKIDSSVSFGEPIPLCSSSPPPIPQISGPSFGQPFLLASSPMKSPSEVGRVDINLRGGPPGDTDMTRYEGPSNAAFGEPFLLGSFPEDHTLNDGLMDVGSSCRPSLWHGSSSKQGLGLKEEVNVDIDLTLEDWDNGDDESLVELKADNEKDEESEATLAQVETQDVLDELDPIAPSFDDWENELTLVDEDSKFGIFDKDPGSSTPGLLPQVSADCNVKSRCLGLSGNNAFSVLMSSFKENAAWKEADVAEDRTFRPVKANGGRRKAPFYKVLQGMPIAVDAFKYGAIPGVTAYFLTHAHSDHYTNLSSNWKNGSIYCSEGTANLIIHMLSVDKKWIHPLPMDTPTVVPNTNGVTVTLIEANHCPGSCLFFFEGPQSVNAGDSTYKSSYVGSSRTFRYLHCGDFRASPRHVLHPAVRGKSIDHVYLDTTYLDPKYTFPPQPLVISACAELVKRVINGEEIREKPSGMLSWIAPLNSKGKGKETEKNKTKSLVVVGTYSIGKERIVKAIAHALGSKVYCDPRKTAILKCQADPELDALLTTDPKAAIVHLVPLSTIATDRLKIYLERFPEAYDRVIGFRPTGWTFTQAAGTDQLPSVFTILSKNSQQGFTHSDLHLTKNSTTTLQLYPVPYSEHSSFYELTCFAMSFSWTKMIATVNVGSESSRAKMAKWVAKWEAERKKRGKDTIVPHRNPDYW